MGRKTTKVHFVNADDSHFLRQYVEFHKIKIADLKFKLPFPIHPQSLYAGIRGDVVTEETKEAIETLAASLRKQGNISPVPIWSTR